MKITNLKKLTAAVALIAALGMFTACSSEKPDDTKSTENPAIVTTAPETTDPVETTAPEATEPVETTAPEATEPVETSAPEATDPVETSAPEATDPVETTVPEETVPETTGGDTNTELTGNWLDMQFVLDGVTYQIPCAYKDLAANGWTFDIAELGYENGYYLNPGDKVYGTIDLKNETYSDKISVMIGLKNNSDELLDIYDCDIWTITVQTDYAFKLIDPHPEMMIGNGLKFGDSDEQIISLCGPCDEDDIFVSEDYGYRTYEYFVDFTYMLKITVYDEYGITCFQLQDYS